MNEAVSRFIEDGDSIVMGAALEAAIPFAVGHEIIRQGRKDLTLVGPISDMLFDQMIGSGCVKKVAAAWVGNVIMGVGYNMRRAVEEGIPRKIEVEDYTNFTISLALHAGALGIPFIPTKSLLGTGMIAERRLFKEMECPYTREKLALVPALKPDVAIGQVQRAECPFLGWEWCDQRGGPGGSKGDRGGGRDCKQKSNSKRPKPHPYPWIFSKCSCSRTLGSPPITDTRLL
jgi:glutaconate CoA-transferase subunit A